MPPRPLRAGQRDRAAERGDREDRRERERTEAEHERERPRRAPHPVAREREVGGHERADAGRRVERGARRWILGRGRRRRHQDQRSGRGDADDRTGGGLSLAVAGELAASFGPGPRRGRDGARPVRQRGSVAIDGCPGAAGRGPGCPGEAARSAAPVSGSCTASAVAGAPRARSASTSAGRHPARALLAHRLDLAKRLHDAVIAGHLALDPQPRAAIGDDGQVDARQRDGDRQHVAVEAHGHGEPRCGLLVGEELQQRALDGDRRRTVRPRGGGGQRSAMREASGCGRPCAPARA